MTAHMYCCSVQQYVFTEHFSATAELYCLTCWLQYMLPI